MGVQGSDMQIEVGGYLHPFRHGPGSLLSRFDQCSLAQRPC